MRVKNNRIHSQLLALFILTLNLAWVPQIVSAADADDEDEGPAKPLSELIVTAKRLDAARADIEPSLGASTYTLSGEMVDNRPGSESLNINHILLQAPGVTQVYGVSAYGTELGW